MELTRNTESNRRGTKRGHRKYSSDVRQKINHYGRASDGSNVIAANFPNFGGGEQTSNFTVYLEWLDIERAIEFFAENGNPNAIRLKRAKDLASAVENILKPPQSN